MQTSVTQTGSPGGDVNGDGDIGIADAVAALRTSAGLTGFAYSGADVNGDTKIGVEEAVYVLQAIAGLR